MVRDSLPFQPIRSELYTSAELSAGFNASRPESMSEMRDFQTYRYFVRQGRATPADPYAGMMEALHDNSILQAMFAFLKEQREQKNRKIAAIMGGHREPRGSPAYRSVMLLSKRLSERDFLMASGGGPGAMEATHLGALLQGSSEREVDQALALLEAQPKLPEGADTVLSEDGMELNREVSAALHGWATPAHKLVEKLGMNGVSLAVPTWHYGHEPVTPLASHAAKFFQNSIREDVLLLLAAQGIIFAPGAAGTLQEVFQDTAQNYYAVPKGVFSPMIFFDVDGFWSKTLPVFPLLEALFVGRGGPQRAELFRKNVHVMSDVDQIVDWLVGEGGKTELFDQRLMNMGMRAMATKANLLPD